MLDSSQKIEILGLARASIAARFNQPTPTIPSHSLYRQRRGIFVSLHKYGNLRGCIGYIKGYKALGDSIIEMAKAAAFNDPRFPPIKGEELDKIQIEISILGDLILVDSLDDIVVGRDGLYIDHPYGSGLLLPQVATEWNWDLDQFLKQLCRKAGLASEAFQDESARLYRFEAEVFSEE